MAASRLRAMSPVGAVLDAVEMPARSTLLVHDLIHRARMSARMDCEVARMDARRGRKCGTIDLKGAIGVSAVGPDECLGGALFSNLAGSASYGY